MLTALAIGYGSVIAGNAVLIAHLLRRHRRADRRAATEVQQLEAAFALPAAAR